MDLAAAIRNEVKVAKSLTASHRLVEFRIGRRQGLDLALADYICALCPRYEPAMVARWCAAGHVTVDGAPCQGGQPVASGQRVVLEVPLPPPDPGYVPPPLQLVHHDRHLAVAAKAPGHLAHQAGKIMTGTLINQLQDWALAGGLDPNDLRLVNRIDRDTSGLVLASLNLPAHRALSELMQERRMVKEYLAICEGVPEPAQGDWQEPIGEDPRKPQLRRVHPDGLPAHTGYRVAAAAPEGRYALLALTLHTGRQHQIRLHCAHHGHPLVGDWVYGHACQGLDGQALHAERLAFRHPITGEDLDLRVPLPPLLAGFWERLAAGGSVEPRELTAEQKGKLGKE